MAATPQPKRKRKEETRRKTRRNKKKKGENFVDKPRKRDTAAMPLLYLSHEKVFAHFTPIKW